MYKRIENDVLLKTIWNTERLSRKWIKLINLMKEDYIFDQQNHNNQLI